MPLSDDGLFEPATCSECRMLVVAVRRIFRYDYEPCSSCGLSIRRGNIFGTGWYVTTGPSKIVCPKCDKPGMLITPLPRTHIENGYAFPNVGDTIHALLSSKGIIIPHLYTLTGSVWFEKTPRLPIGTVVAATVLAISTIGVNHGEVEKPRRGVKDLQLRYDFVVDLE